MWQPRSQASFLSMRAYVSFRSARLVPERLDLGPLEHQAGLVGLQDLEVVVRPPVRGDELAGGGLAHVSGSSS